MSHTEIDRARIQIPEILLNDEAQAQLRMMWEFDPTLEGLVFRFSIDGKGCDGFDYACGFDHPHAEDFKIPVPGVTGLFFAFDPFAAHHMPKVELLFERDLNSGSEGFVIKNLAQGEFKGKFWRKNPDKALPLKD